MREKEKPVEEWVPSVQKSNPIWSKDLKEVMFDCAMNLEEILKEGDYGVPENEKWISSIREDSIQ